MRFSTSNSLSRRPTAQDDKFGPFGVTRAVHCHYFGYTQHKSEPATICEGFAKYIQHDRTQFDRERRRISGL